MGVAIIPAHTLGVIMVITVHVTTPFLHSVLFRTHFFFAHTCVIKEDEVIVEKYNNINS